MLVCQPTANSADLSLNARLLNEARLAREDRARKKAQEEQMEVENEGDSRTERSSVVTCHKVPAADAAQIQAKPSEMEQVSAVDLLPGPKVSSAAVAQKSLASEVIVLDDDDDEMVVLDEIADAISVHSAPCVAYNSPSPATQSLGGSADVSAAWSCTACTFENEASEHSCSMCGKMRTQAAKGDTSCVPPQVQKCQHENTAAREEEASTGSTTHPNFQRLREKFPHHSEETIKNIWNRERGDFEACEDLLLCTKQDLISKSVAVGSSSRNVSKEPSFEAVGAKFQTDSMDWEDGCDQENSDGNRKRACDVLALTGSACQPQENGSDPAAMCPSQKKPRGRPKGSKNSKPRKQKESAAEGAADAGRPNFSPRPGDCEVMDLTCSAPREETRCEGPRQVQAPNQAPPPLQRASAIARPPPRDSSSPALPSHPPAPSMPQASLNGAQGDLTHNSSGVQDRAAPPASVPRPPGGGAQTKGSGAMQPAGPLFALPPEEVWGKVYPDLRPWVVAELYKIAKSKHNQTHNDGAFHCHVRALMQVALHLHPICKLGAAQKIPGIGPQSIKELKEVYTAKASTRPPVAGKFAAATAAALVGMYDFEREKGDAGDGFCSAEELLRRTRGRMDPQCPGITQSDRDVGWVQLKKLMMDKTGNPQYIKERKRNKETCYELLDAGREVAKTLLAKQWNQSAQGPFTHLHSENGTISQEFEGVMMAVDFREGGGFRFSKFEDLCVALDKAKQPYFARSLPIADYLWFCHGNRVAPVLVERKSAADVAASIFDHRWESQQNKMLQARSVYQSNLRLIYIIEGNAKDCVVSGTEWVSDVKFRVTVERVNSEVELLKARGFEVICTTNITGTAKKLAVIHKELVCAVRSGALDKCLTFADFDQELKAAQPVDVSTMAIPRAAPVPVHGAVSGGGGVGNAAAAAAAAATAQQRPQEDGEAGAEEGTEKEELMKLSTADLKKKCEERGEAISGKKGELVDRLLGPPKPQLWVDRKRTGQYHPQLDSANAAIMVAMLLQNGPMTQKEILDEAEATAISKETMYASAGCHYDGWSSHMKLINNDLMKQQRVNKGKAQYTLTQEGKDLADAMHKWAHRDGKCKCGAQQ